MPPISARLSANQRQATAPPRPAPSPAPGARDSGVYAGRAGAGPIVRLRPMAAALGSEGSGALGGVRPMGVRCGRRARRSARAALGAPAPEHGAAERAGLSRSPRRDRLAYGDRRSPRNRRAARPLQRPGSAAPRPGAAPVGGRAAPPGGPAAPRRPGPTGRIPVPPAGICCGGGGSLRRDRSLVGPEPPPVQYRATFRNQAVVLRSPGTIRLDISAVPRLRAELTIKY